MEGTPTSDLLSSSSPSPTRPVTRRTTCRLCNSPNLIELYSLGDQYVSDFVPKEKEFRIGIKCPIEIVLCQDCTLVQQRYTAPQELLYSRHYWYRSGVTQTMRDALTDVAVSAISRANLIPGDVVLDIGSNDGTLLRFYNDSLIRVGVEPADNLATEENYCGLGLAHDFWGGPDGALMSGRYFAAIIDNRILECLAGHSTDAKIVTACGMFYDLEDPNQFIADVAKVLHPEGVFVAQLMCLKQMMDLSDVGNLCHEHLEFYSLKSLQHLFSKHGLQIFDVEENKVNGGSYRIYACLMGTRPVASRIQGFYEAESFGLKIQDPYSHYAWFSKAKMNRDSVSKLIRGLTQNGGKRIWVYGASTKGNVLLQWYGLDSSIIEAAADRSPEKWGKFTVGTGIPIKSEDDFRASNPDYALVLPYAFLSEFVEREKEWRDKGGRFIVPLPELRIV